MKTLRIATYSMVISGLILQGCARLEFVPEDLDEDFSRSDKSAEELIDTLPFTQNYLELVEGSARAQIRTPAGTDRANISFKANREQSLITVRNNLGIEGGRMLADRDSVLIYDRLESEAYKLSHSEAADYYLQGMTAINLLAILQPEFSGIRDFTLYESRTSYVLISGNDARYFIGKDDLLMQKIEFPAEFGYDFAEVHFEEYADYGEHRLPVRMKILSSDGRTEIFLLLRSIDANPGEVNFDPQIPSDITIRRV